MFILKVLIFLLSFMFDGKSCHMCGPVRVICLVLIGFYIVCVVDFVVLSLYISWAIVCEYKLLISSIFSFWKIGLVCALYLSRPRRGLWGIVFTRSVCLFVCESVCVSVCPANILVFYSSAIRRDIDLKSIQDTNMVVLNSLEKNWPSYVKGHRDGTLLFEGTVISQKLSHRKISIFFHRHLLGYSIRWNNKNLSEQRNDVTKNTSIFDFNM